MQTPEPGQAARYKEEVRQQWTERAASFRATATALSAATDLMLGALDRRPGMRVLDVASGPGEPALSIAAVLASTGGHVTATDLVPEMLAAAEESARARGIANVAFQQADAESLPFPDVTFDAVTCRFGVMLFPDTRAALGEMRRVLRDNGQIVCIVWGPPEQDAMSRTLAVARDALGLAAPPPPPDAPHRFRYAASGALAAQLRAAGFRRVEDTQHTIPIRATGTAEEWWDVMLNMDGALREAVAALDADRRAALRQTVLDAKRAAMAAPGGETSAVVVATGVR